MRKTLAIVGFAALISAAPALVPKAHADHLWIAAGAGFRIGNLAFSLVLGDAPYGAPDYYWRTEAPIRYPGYGCSDACFIDHDVYYHAASCPLVGHHLHRYGYEPSRVIVRWGPRYRHDHRYHRSYDHRRYDRYDHRRYDDRRYYGRDRGYHRDDRYDRRRYDRRHQGYDHRYDRRRAPDHHRYDRRYDRRRGDDRHRDGDRRHDDRRRRDRRHVRPR